CPGGSDSRAAQEAESPKARSQAEPGNERKSSERRRGAVPSPAPPWSSSPSPGVLDQAHSAGTEVSSLRLMKGEKRARHFTSTIEFLSPALPKFPCVPSRPCRHNPRIALRTRRDSGSSVTITGMLGNLRGETFDRCSILSCYYA